MARPVRVLVVDDSALFQRLFQDILSQDPEIEVVGTAENPLRAREMIKQLNPDVLTLDIEMPEMDGLSFLDRLMRLRPMPVVMVSTLTQVGAEEALTALELGAVDYFPKPTVAAGEAISAQAAEFCAKVKAAGRAKVRPRPDPIAARPPAAAAGTAFDASRKIVAIGSSTGGVEALRDILRAFPAACPATVITQHMPPHFTETFAKRLDAMMAPNVKEARNGDKLMVGTVYIAPSGDNHLEVVGGAGGFSCRVGPGAPVSGHRPSVDKLFHSVAGAVGKRAIGVILTGMGHDGAEGLKHIRDSGGRTLGQSEDTCVVYGMPRVAYEMGGVEKQVRLPQIAKEIFNLCATD
ncbi:MAG: chemotaxis response regulator protein-glutamate methylesterase [Proteobacteria bacterium]|nr:chemotaxis response regulator protein-glutamate methylesterase [Pseudomonadota bacterium]